MAYLTSTLAVRATAGRGTIPQAQAASLFPCHRHILRPISLIYTCVLGRWRSSRGFRDRRTPLGGCVSPLRRCAGALSRARWHPLHCSGAPANAHASAHHAMSSRRPGKQHAARREQLCSCLRRCAGEAHLTTFARFIAGPAAPPPPNGAGSSCSVCSRVNVPSSESRSASSLCLAFSASSRKYSASSLSKAARTPHGSQHIVSAKRAVLS